MLAFTRRMGLNPVTCIALMVLNSCAVTGKARRSPVSTFTSPPVNNWYHGEEPENRSTLDDWSNAMYIVNPADSIRQAGKIVSWEYYARRNGAISFLVLRKTIGHNRYTLVSKTSSSSGKGYNKIPLSGPIPVQRGDVLGIYFPGQSIIPYDGTECRTSRTLHVKSPKSVAVGSSYSFSTKETGWEPCRKYSLRAQLVPVIDSNPETTTALLAVQTTTRPNLSTTIGIQVSSPKETENIQASRSSTGAPQYVVGIQILYVIMTRLIL